MKFNHNRDHNRDHTRATLWLLSLALALCLLLGACTAEDVPGDLTGEITDVATETATGVATDTATGVATDTATDETVDETVDEDVRETEKYSCPLHPGNSCECAYGVVAKTLEPVTTGSEPETIPEPETTAPESETRPETEPVTEAPTEPETPPSAEVEVPALSMPSFTAADVPAFGGYPYAEVNGNIPFFTEDQYTTASYEYYSPLDSLGRCGTAVACIGRDLMPTEDRGSISSVKPSGWHSVSYDALGIDSLYNRSHLIAFQLTGENANRENLITGTRFMNQNGMTLFENMVADYVKETGNHVLYRVTPVFTGENLVADGVLMEARSVEDDGDGICYCVYLYNVQPGVEIDYATGESRVSEEEDDGEAAVMDYVINKRNGKFHHDYCSGVASMSESNKQPFRGTRDELVAQGYTPCGLCNP